MEVANCYLNHFSFPLKLPERRGEQRDPRLYPFLCHSYQLLRQFDSLIYRQAQRFKRV
jgi:hypothetical protein